MSSKRYPKNSRLKRSNRLPNAAILLPKWPPG